jgi:hypothetical protein
MADRTTVGLSTEAHSMLQALKEHELFAEMLDGYRFAISLAIASGSSGTPITGGKNTFVNVGTLDKDGALRQIIAALFQCPLEESYDKAELLAEWGVRELDRRFQDGSLDVAELLKELEAIKA